MFMDKEAAENLLNDAAKVLKQNDRGGWTVPAGNLYPHQWLWDSCFISIGLRHTDIKRAQVELRSLLRGQWGNGMIPHMVFSQKTKDAKKDRAQINPYAPDGINTSGITQPPMVAEAVLKIGEMLKVSERRSWYKEMLPGLTAYHQWLYNDRDPHKEGLVLLIHPWECGLDDTPPWISELRKHSMPRWIRLFEKFHLGWTASLVRRDTKFVPPNQRMSNIEAMAYWSAMRRIRRKAFNSEAILSRSLFSVEDLAFNCIFIRASECLKKIARDAGHQLPDSLLENVNRSQEALDKLWDEPTGLYYSRSFVSHKLIQEPTIASLLPLYSGAISKNRAQELPPSGQYQACLKIPHILTLCATGRALLG
jgi:hypothetical protein